MSALFQNLKVAVQDNFASALFLFVVGTIAFAFIGYLLIDWLRTRSMAARTRHRHRPSRHENEHSLK